MKYLLGIVVLVAVVAAALLWVPMKDGRPLLDRAKVETVFRDTARTVAPDQSGWVGDNGAATLYRWRDANGNWQYGDAPPSGVRAEAVEQKEVRTVSGSESLKGVAPDAATNP